MLFRSFLSVNLALAIVIVWQIVDAPYALSIFFTAIIVTIAFELGSGLLRAAEIAGDLAVKRSELALSEQQMMLSAEAAKIGIWTRDVKSGKLWINDKCGEIFGRARGGTVRYHEIIAAVHPDDRETVVDRKSTRLNSSHTDISRMPSSA
mgnify:CR=1 FL=1